MKKAILTLTVTILIAGLQSLKSQDMKSMREKAKWMLQEPKTLEEVKKYALGEWKSLSVELRPTEDRTGSGNIQPTFLKRHFLFNTDDTFVGTITLFADNYGKIPLMEFEFKGDLVWGEEHPIADGAWNIDYVLNKGFSVTPLHEQSVQMLNSGLPEGMSSFQANIKKDILGKAFPMFHIIEGQIVSDYDLIYFKNGLLFMGAKHVDGTPFDKVENRPHQLQIPLEKI
jgi:hypothetical protein